MNIEITDLDMILNYLETTSLEPHDDYSSKFTYKDQKILYKYIKQLKENYERIYNENCKLRKEHNITDISLLDKNYKLKDNWNKLKQKMIDSFNESQDVQFLDVLQDMQEIEQGSDSNE